MNGREKILAIAVASLVALWGASQGWDKYQAAVERSLNTQRNVAQKLSTARTATARGQRAQQKIHQWKQQSLPTNPDIAKSLYQDWLQQQLTAAGLEVAELKISSTHARPTSFQQFSFVASATGKLEQLTEFLYGFYQAQHLHRISQATFSPTKDRKALQISLTIDALSLAEGTRKNQLADGTLDPFKQSLEQFRESITGRNLFATYEPPKPPKPEPTDTAKEDTDAAQARFSSFNHGRGGWLMSVRMEKTGKVYIFREGDTIEIGKFKGTLERLDGERRRAILSSESGEGQVRRQVRLGQTLAEAEPFGEKPS